MRTNTNLAYAKHLWAMQLLHMAAGRDADYMGDLVSMRMPAVTERRAIAHMRDFLNDQGYRLQSLNPAMIAIVKRDGSIWTLEHLVHDGYPFCHAIGRFSFFNRWIDYWWPPIDQRPWRPPGQKRSVHEFVRECQIRVVA